MFGKMDEDQRNRSLDYVLRNPHNRASLDRAATLKLPVLHHTTRPSGRKPQSPIESSPEGA
jgi:hypothetical protein